MLEFPKIEQNDNMAEGHKLTGLFNLKYSIQSSWVLEKPG